MSVIMPQIEKFQVCDYNYRNLGFTGVEKSLVMHNLKSRKFTVLAEFDNIEDARQWVQDHGGFAREDKPWVTEYTKYVIRFVFKEIEPDESVH